MVLSFTYHLGLILICLLLFVVYILLDYNKYNLFNKHDDEQLDTTIPFCSSCMIEGFDSSWLGRPNTDTNNTLIGYSYLRQGLKDPSKLTLSDQTLLNDGFDMLNDQNDTLDKLQLKMNHPENKKYFNIDEVEKDFMYFNNSTSLQLAMHKNNS
jgi:hypothetical protein